MNQGMYGYGLPPNFATRVAPPKWTNCKAYLTAGTYTDFVVPQNVYQLMICVWGAGGGGGMTGSWVAYYRYYGPASGGDGGGYAHGILDVVPGQKLPTITVGAGGAGGVDYNSTASTGGTSSFGTYLTATGGAGGQSIATGASLSAASPGTGSAYAGLRSYFTATGGKGGMKGCTVNSDAQQARARRSAGGGGGAGSIYGTGGSGGINDTDLSTFTAINYMQYGGGGFGGNSMPISTTGWVANNFPGFYANGGGGLRNSAEQPYGIPGGGGGSGGVGSGPLGGGPGGGGYGTMVYVSGSPNVMSTQANQNAQVLVADSNTYCQYWNLSGGGGGAGYGYASYSYGAGGNGGPGGGGGGAVGTTSGNLGSSGGSGGFGGGGGSAYGDNNYTTGGTGGLGGGGGSALSAGTNLRTLGGNGSMGGGGGACFVQVNGDSPTIPTYSKAGKGGDGGVLIFWTEGY